MHSYTKDTLPGKGFSLNYVGQSDLISVCDTWPLPRFVHVWYISLVLLENMAQKSVFFKVGRGHRQTDLILVCETWPSQHEYMCQVWHIYM